MKWMKEHDVVRLKVDSMVEVLGRNRKQLCPAGSLGTIVLVYTKDGAPVAYEVEFALAGELEFGLATIDADGVEPHP